MTIDHAPAFTNQRIPTLIQSELARMLDASETASLIELEGFHETLADWHVITTTSEATELALAAPLTKHVTIRSRSLADRIFHFVTNRGDWVSRDIERIHIESTPMLEVPMTLGIDRTSFDLLQGDTLDGARRRMTLALMALRESLQANDYTGVFKKHHAIHNANTLGVWLDETNAPSLSRHDLHVRNLRDVLGNVRFEVAERADAS